MKLVVTGGLGLIGARILEIWGNKFEVTIIDNAAAKIVSNLVNIDITQKEAVADLIYDLRPDWIVHLAAYTNVEKAEIDKESADLVNVDATRNLVEAAQDQKCNFLYFSTGFVYEGVKEKYQEDDPTEPVNYYGVTKLAGEKIVQTSGLPYCIARLNYPYRTKWQTKSDTVRWMIDNLKEGKKIDLVADQKISPTFIDDLALVTQKIIAKKAFGVFNTTGSDCLSFYEIGLQVADAFGFDKNLISSTSLDKYIENSNKKAVPPKISCLVSAKIEKELGIKMTDFSSGLKKVKESYDAS